MESKTEWQKLTDRKDKNKLSNKRKLLVIKKANEVLGVKLKYNNECHVDAFNYWIDKINDKL